MLYRNTYLDLLGCLRNMQNNNKFCSTAIRTVPQYPLLRQNKKNPIDKN
jgi:hypothetical protein